MHGTFSASTMNETASGANTSAAAILLTAGPLPLDNTIKVGMFVAGAARRNAKAVPGEAPACHKSTRNESMAIYIRATAFCNAAATATVLCSHS